MHVRSRQFTLIGPNVDSSLHDKNRFGLKKLIRNQYTENPNSVVYLKISRKHNADYALL